MYANLALLNRRRDSHVLNFMYKRQGMDDYLDKHNLSTQAYQTTKFLVPKFQLTQFKNSLLYKGAIIWNQSATELNEIGTYIAFKEQTKLLSRI